MSVRDWESVRAALAAVVRVEATWPTGFRARAAGGQHVTVDLATGSVIPWLVLRVPICRQEEMDLERSLERNGTLAFSTIMLKDGAYWFRVAVPFDSVELEDPARLVILSLQAAQHLSPARVEVEPNAGACFSHYAD